MRTDTAKPTDVLAVEAGLLLHTLTVMHGEAAVMDAAQRGELTFPLDATFFERHAGAINTILATRYQSALSLHRDFDPTDPLCLGPINRRLAAHVAVECVILDEIFGGPRPLPARGKVTFLAAFRKHKGS